MLVKTNIVEYDGNDDNPAVSKENESLDQLMLSYFLDDLKFFILPALKVLPGSFLPDIFTISRLMSNPETS